jgi:putative sterol carrier protein
MCEDIRAFFTTLSSRADPSIAHGMSNSYVFDVEGVGRWRVEVNLGTVTVTEGDGDADVVFKSSRDTFSKIIAGKQNPTTAVMTGKLKLKGDVDAAMGAQKLFKL